MARRILITSGKGGVGKTSVTAHLGYALSKRGFKTVLIDMDTGLNNLDVVTGIESKIIYDLYDVTDGKCRVAEALKEHSKTLSILPAKNRFNRDLTGKNLRDLTEGLSKRFDYILVDSPAGIEEGFKRAASCCDEAIIVVTPTLTSLRDADKVLTILNNFDLIKTGVIVNRIRGDLLVKGLISDHKEIADFLKCPVIGCIPEDDRVYLAADLDIYGSRAEKAFKMAAKYLAAGKGKLYDNKAFYKGLSGAIRRSLRQNI